MSRLSRRMLLRLAAAVAVLAAMAGAAPALAHGTLDQHLQGNPDCTAANFRGFTSSGSPLHQEVFPSGADLLGVDVCVKTSSASQSVNVQIRQGSAASPGSLLASGSGTAGPAGVQWVHVEFALATTPGTMLVLTLPNTSSYQWRSLCGAVAGSCTSVDDDLYPYGVSDRGDEADFGFRTYSTFPASQPFGFPDQFLAGDPACTGENFRGFSGGIGSFAQEFVPDAPGLIGVALCIETAQPEVDVTVLVRTGTAQELGSIVGGGTARAHAVGFQFVAVSFSDIYPTTPGTTYVLQVPGSAHFLWRSLCGAIRGECTSVDPDLYPKGESNRGDMADYGFRTFGGTPPGLPVGPSDQHMLGDPPCNASSFPSFVSSGGPLRQEVVPASPGLDAVDLCVQTFAPGQPVTITIRQGTAAAPGAVFGTATATVREPGFQWVRLDLTNVLPTTPGVMFVIEVPASATWQWRNTCPAGPGTCTAAEPDLYPAGTPGSGTWDYGFRTVGGTPLVQHMLLTARD